MFMFVSLSRFRVWQITLDSHIHWTQWISFNCKVFQFVSTFSLHRRSFISFFNCQWFMVLSIYFAVLVQKRKKKKEEKTSIYLFDTLHSYSCSPNMNAFTLHTNTSAHSTRIRNSVSQRLRVTSENKYASREGTLISDIWKNIINNDREHFIKQIITNAK